jgi:hypothetical protein
MRIRPLLIVGCLVSMSALGAGEPVRLAADQLELFVDRHLIDRLEGAELRLNRPVDRGPVMTFDAPWEGPYVAYITIIKDGPVYRMYYRGKPELTPTGDSNEVTCYAESADGIRWNRPDLALFEVRGTRKNNVILDSSFSPIPTDFSPFLDTRPGVPQAERYKALGGRFDGRVGEMDASRDRPPPGVQRIRSSGGLLALSSPDGIRWKRMSDRPVISPLNYPYSADPSLLPAFWSEHEKCYVALIRTRTSAAELERVRAQGRGSVTPVEGGAMRWIGRTTSRDFVNWSRVEMMEYESPAGEQIYTNNTSPYFRARHIYLGLAARIVFDRPVITREEAARIKVNPLYINDSAEPVLLTSRGGTRYDRAFLGPLVPNGLGPEDWTSRNNYPALNIVPTGPSEMSFYVEKGYGQPTHHLQRYSLELDRLASITASLAGGECITKPLVFSGKSLLVNFATSVLGGIRIEIQTGNGRPIEGYTLADAVQLVGNSIARPARWKGGSDVSRLNGTEVRLRFVMNEADLYALRFASAD